MNRRDFFNDLVGVMIALNVPPDTIQETVERFRGFIDQLESATDPVEFWRAVREQFLLDSDIVHFNCGSVGASPRIVIDAIAAATRQLENNPYRHQFGDGLYAGLEETRKHAATLLGTEIEDISITQNATSGMNSIANGLRLQPGDEVLTTNHEHPGGMACWQFLAKHHGIKINCVRLTPSIASGDAIVDLIGSAITARTRVFSFCHVDPITGLIMPIERISALARERNIFFVCDGAQSPGMIAIDLRELGVDGFVCSGHKWLLGPKGSGLLYLRKESRDRVHTIELSDFTTYSATKGTVNIPHTLGLMTSIQFLQTIGMEKIEARTRELATRLRQRLSEVKSIRCLTPAAADMSAGLSTFAIDPKKANSYELLTKLEKGHGIYVRPAQVTYALVAGPQAKPENYNALRFSTHIFNNEAEIDRVSDVLRKILI